MTERPEAPEPQEPREEGARPSDVPPPQGDPVVPDDLSGLDDLEPGPAEEAGGAADESDLLGDDLAKAQSDNAALTADLQRLQAEYVNYKRRVDRDREAMGRNATVAVLTALLPVLDDVDRAREHGELTGGFKAVADGLEKLVTGFGLEKYGAPGDEFDPTLHEALMHGHSPDVTTTTCDKIVQAGYRIGDRVVRAAMVTVVDPEEPAADSSEGDAPESAEDAEPESPQDTEGSDS